MALRQLKLDSIDPTLRTNFEALRDYLQESSILKGEWKHFEIVVDGAVSNKKYKHNLGFTPKDVLVTFDTAGVSWAYASFDDTNVQFSTSGSGIIRVFIGRYANNA